MTRLTVEKHARKNIYKTNNSDEKVFIRIKNRRRKFAKKHEVFLVVSRNRGKRYQGNTYLVKHILLNSDESTKAKFRVEDIYDFPKDKNVNANENEKNKERKANQKSLRNPETRNDLIDVITDQGYIINYNSPVHGSCQFDPHKH